MGSRTLTPTSASDISLLSPILSLLSPLVDGVFDQAVMHANLELYALKFCSETVQYENRSVALLEVFVDFGEDLLGVVVSIEAFGHEALETRNQVHEVDISGIALQFDAALHKVGNININAAMIRKHRKELRNVRYFYFETVCPSLDEGVFCASAEFLVCDMPATVII